MFNFKENLYYIAAINYFLKGNNFVEVENFDIMIGHPKKDKYKGLVLKRNKNIISFPVGIINKTSKNGGKKPVESYYSTKFYKEIDMEELESLSKEDLVRFIFKPETITNKSCLQPKYGNIVSDDKSVYEFGNLSTSNPPLKVQIEIAKLAKKEVNDIPNILDQEKQKRLQKM